MQSDIRKDHGKGGQEDKSRQGAEVRRSRRDRVPNNKYAESIEELRRSVTGKESRLRNDRNQNSDESSWSHRKGEDEDYNRSDGSEWMKCMITDGIDSKPRLIELEYEEVPESPNSETSEYSELRNRHISMRRAEEEPQPQEQPRKLVKKPSESNPGGKSNLLEILMMAAKKVAEEPEQRQRQSAKERQGGSQNNDDETPMEIEDNDSFSQPVDDSDGRIIRVVQHPDKIVFQHSRNGRVEVPASWSSQRPQRQPAVPAQSDKLHTEHLEKAIAEFKRKIHTPLILT